MEQVAAALVALTALAVIRDSCPLVHASSSPPQSNPPPETLRLWHIDRRNIAADAALNDLSWLSNHSANATAACVVGPPSYTSDVLYHTSRLMSSRPEEFIFPHLLEPLPADTSHPQWQPTSYVGASLDDDIQPAAAAGCIWLHRTTLQTLAAGIVPAALHDVIVPWIQRRQRSRPRVVNFPTSSLKRNHPVLHEPASEPPPEVFPQPFPGAVSALLQQPTIHSSPQRPQRDGASLAVTAMRGAAALWNRHNDLTAQQVAATKPLPVRHRSQRKRRRLVAAPTHNTPYLSENRLSPVKAPALRRCQPPACLTPREALAPGPVSVPRTLPVIGRVHHPGKDPDETIQLPHG